MSDLQRILTSCCRLNSYLLYDHLACACVCVWLLSGITDSPSALRGDAVITVVLLY